jgi:hypothetical protein
LAVLPVVLLMAAAVRGVRQQLDPPQALGQRDVALLVVRQLVCQRFLLVAEPQALVPRGEKPRVLALQLFPPWRLALVLQV